jgi:hypothetical protein
MPPVVTGERPGHLSSLRALDPNRYAVVVDGRDARAVVEVCDVRGIVVQSLTGEEVSTDQTWFTFDASGFPSGLYVVTVVSRGRRAVHAIVRAR